MNLLKRSILCLGMLSAFALVGCGAKTDSDKKEVTEKAVEPVKEAAAEKVVENLADKVVTVYSTRHYDSDKEIIKEFTEKTGIKVEVVKNKGGALIEQLKSEGKDSPADIFFTADAGNLAIAKNADLFQAIESEVVTENIPAKLRDKDNMWTGLTKRARVIVYSKDRVKPADLSTYEDLADPKWKGKILIRSSSNQYNRSLVASFLDEKIMGKEKTTAWLKGFVANFAREPKGNDRKQGQAVYAGEGDIAIMNTYYLGKMINDKKDAEMKAAGENIAIFFPNQETTGTHINVSGAGVLKTADSKEAAVKFLEFLSSVEAQEKFAAANYEFPANPKAEIKDEFLKSLGEFKEQDINLSVLGENNKEAVQLMDEAGWK